MSASPNFGGLVLGCIDAEFCKYTVHFLLKILMFSNMCKISVNLVNLHVDFGGFFSEFRETSQSFSTSVEFCMKMSKILYI